MYYGSRVFSYPPTAMTENTTNIQNQLYGNGNYIASASSKGFTPSGETQPFFAFDDGNAFWRSGGFYPNPTRQTTTTEGVVLGEWLQIQLPVPIVLGEFFMIPNATQSPRPRNITLLGCNDPANPWNVIYTNDNIVFDNSGSYFSVNATQSYSYYRFVITSIRGAASAEVLEWSLFEKPALSSGYLEPNDDGTNTGSTEPNDFIYKI